MFYLVETGLNGEPGCYRCSASVLLKRGREVICRTGRGLETGRVSAPLGGESGGLELAGQLIRPMSDNDRLIARRLQQFRDRAVSACEKMLVEMQVPAVLVDAEQLFDGEGLYFHFLGPVDESLNPVLEKLAAVYEQKIRFRQFAERLAEGCGPGCGTSKSGCATTGGCSGCALPGGCGSKKATA